MAFSKEIGIYKSKILNTIFSDYELIRLIDKNYVNETTKKVVNSDELKYVKVFPYYFKPDSTLNAMSFIILKIDTPKVSGKLIKSMMITITCITHQSLMEVPYGIGTRIDQMGACIDRLFNGRDDLGFGYIELVSSYESSIDEYNRCREIRFEVEDFNNTRSNL